MSVLFLALGGFLLGGAWTIWRDAGRGSRGTLVGVLVLLCGLGLVAGGLANL